MPFSPPPLPTVAIIRTAIFSPDPLGFSLHPPSSYSPPLLPFNCFFNASEKLRLLTHISSLYSSVFLFHSTVIALLWLLISVETEVDDSYRSSLVDYGIFVETEVDSPAPVSADSIVCGALHSKSYLKLRLISVQRPF